MEKLFDFLNTSAALVLTETNRFYLTDFRSSLGYLFLVKGKKILYTDGRYIEAAKKQARKDCEVRLFKNAADTVSEVSAEFSPEVILLETDITVAEAQRTAKLADGRAKPSQELTDFLNNLRSVKSSAEKEYIISAQRIAEKAFDNALTYIKAGMTEKEIALRLEYDMRSFGADGTSFETIVVSGKNSSLPHGVPSQKVIENGDFITMDFGALYKGYCSDMTRTVAVGFATEEMRAVYSTVLSAQLKGIEKIKAGEMCKNVDKAVRDTINADGYGKFFTHGTGHGVGLYIHESPTLSVRSEEILRVGNVVTCEPGIYLEGKFGVRIEDMLFVTENGAQNLTNSQKNLIIIK